MSETYPDSAAATNGPNDGDRLWQRLQTTWPIRRWRDVTTLVAVSGGSDSVALLLAMHRLLSAEAIHTGRLVVVHVNHQWRGVRSDKDAEFVGDLSKQLNLDCVIRTAAELGGDAQVQTEAAARDLRLACFEQVASEWGARYVATGHTADDQAETILHRIVRGTGVRGLAGVPTSRLLNPSLTIMRPLLDYRRQELMDFLDKVEQPFRTDDSNVDVRYTRNRIRNELLPQLRELNADVVDSLCRLASISRDYAEEVSLQVDELIDSSVDIGDQVAISVTAIGERTPLVQRELFAEIWRRKSWPLRSMGFRQWCDLQQMLCEPKSPPKMMPGGVRVEHVFSGLDHRLVLRRDEGIGSPRS